MIFTLLLNFLFLIIDGVVSILPASQGLPSGINDAFQYFIYQISQWTFIFPIATVFTILGWTLLIESTLWLFHGATWVYNKIRGI